jgi:hypothetical protein
MHRSAVFSLSQNTAFASHLHLPNATDGVPRVIDH